MSQEKIIFKRGTKVLKKILMLLMVLALVFSFVVGCSSDNADENPPADDQEQTDGDDPAEEEEPATGDEIVVADLEDGTYKAEEDEFSETGWKYNVTLMVKDGKITEVNWNGENKEGGDDKKTVSENGEYGMVEKGDAIAEWHEQAKAAEDYLIETQDPSPEIDYNDEGKTDAISGATITVQPLFELSQKALKAGPVK